jgi:lysophospholipase
MSVLSIFILSFMSVTSHALTEGELKDLRHLEAFYATRSSGFFAGQGDVKIAYGHFLKPGSEKEIVICPGWTEPSLKYAELIEDFFNQGYSVSILDHRGQGNSGRMIDDSQGGYVDNFRDYENDFSTFMKTQVLPRKPKMLFLFAHSMGAAICTLYVDTHPHVFKGVVLSAPMFGVKTSGIPQEIVEPLLDATIWLGFGRSPLFGDRHLGPQKIENSTTQSAARFRIKEMIYAAHPETKVTYATYRWLRESLRMTSAIAEIPPKEFEPPTLLLQAGQDHLVKSAPQDEFCQKAKACSKVEFPQSRHEILNERDFIRNSALDRILRFYRDAALPPPAPRPSVAVYANDLPELPTHTQPTPSDSPEKH